MAHNWISQFYDEEFSEHDALVAATRLALREPFLALVAAAAATIQRGGKIMLFGNGGSAGDAQHLATELTIRYKADRAPIAAIALTTDSSALTAGGNDLGFDHVFSRQLEALAKPGDLALGISTSGQSPNVLEALKVARHLGCKTAALSGKDGGKLPELTDVLLVVPSQTTARIQELHIMLGQMLCGALEIELGLAPRPGAQ